MAKNIGASVYQRIRNDAKQRGMNADKLLTRYALERLLFRIGESEHRDKFVLKGGLAFVAWTGDWARPTKDIDLHGMNPDDAETVEAILRDVCSIDCDDGVTFDFASLKVERIKEGFVPGARLHFDAFVHTSRIRMRVDAGFGNVLTPGPKQARLRRPSRRPATAGGPRFLPRKTSTACPTTSGHRKARTGRGSARRRPSPTVRRTCLRSSPN